MEGSNETDFNFLPSRQSCMMGELKAVYEITKQLEEVLNQISNVDRTELIQQVNELIEQREEMIQRLSKPYSSEEIKIGRQIIHMNNLIKEKMDLLYQNVKEDMKQVQKIKTQNYNMNNINKEKIDLLYKNVKEDMKQVKKRKTQSYSYLKPYGDLKTPDGMYMDDKL